MLQAEEEVLFLISIHVRVSSLIFTFLHLRKSKNELSFFSYLNINLPLHLCRQTLRSTYIASSFKTIYIRYSNNWKDEGHSRYIVYLCFYHW